MIKQQLLQIARQKLPVTARRKIARLGCWPPVGMVRFGSLRRVVPVSLESGFDRGQPIDRYYIEQFLAANSDDVGGHVLEIGADLYTRAYGGERVTHGDVLHVVESRPGVTVVGDLTDADFLKSDAFDCIILTQTLQFIYDVRSVFGTAYRTLKPGGCLLATVPGISPLSNYDKERWGHYWSFTSQSLRRLVETEFPTSNVQINAYGNVLAAISFLHGLASTELRSSELDVRDPLYEVLVTVRAVKPESNH
jgi:SAM-dependent methyltransferase